VPAFTSALDAQGLMISAAATTTRSPRSLGKLVTASSRAARDPRRAKVLASAI
jgi:hypothetical protein